MPSPAESAEPKALVRSYSLEVPERLSPDNEAYHLGQLLHQSAIPWQKFFEPSDITEDDNPVTKVIAVEASRLQVKWRQFYRTSDKDDKLDLETSEPSIEGVLAMVQQTNARYRNKRRGGSTGKVVNFFHKLCEGIEAHSGLLELLPEGNEYVSIFTGSVNIILKASINHEKICESFSKALNSVSENIIECQAELEIFRTKPVLEKVADLYAHIFKFLASVMDWIMQRRIKRMLKSFNENLYDKYEAEINAINAMSASIRNLVAQASRAEVRAIRMGVHGLGRDIRIGLQGQARQQAELDYHATRFHTELSEARSERRALQEQGKEVKALLGQLNSLLQQNAVIWVQGSESATPPPQRIEFLGGDGLGYGQSRQPALMAAQLVSIGPSKEWLAHDVALSSAHLEDFFDRDRVRLPCDPTGPAMIRREVLERIIQWTSSAENDSPLLWLDGPPIEADGFDNPLSMLAAKFIELASASRVPVLSYFCGLQPHEPAGLTREEHGLLALVSALIRQMVELLLPAFDTDTDLSSSRFRKLDGTVSSWQESVELLRCLAILMPARIFCVIDGMHWIDDGSAQNWMERLVQVLRSTQLRILLTTTGRCFCLREEIPLEEALEIDGLGLSGPEDMTVEFEDE